MKNVLRLVTIMGAVVAASFTAPVTAHEGHDHDAPTTIKAPKGGIIKALDESRVEVVAKGKNIKIYLYDKTMKPAPASDFKIAAKAELPRTKKVDEIKLEPKDNFFEGNYDAKGAHRYTLKLDVNHSKINETVALNFTIEPRK